jgi:hypothetical protein
MVLIEWYKRHKRGFYIKPIDYDKSKNRTWYLLFDYNYDTKRCGLGVYVGY